MKKIFFGIYVVLVLLLIGACKKNKSEQPFNPGGKTIYVAGSFENSAGVSVPTVWVNGVPQPLGTTEGGAYGIFLSGSDVYVTGYEITGGSNRAAKVWKNGVPQTLPASTAYASGEQIFVANGKVYVLGFENFSYKTALWIDGIKQSVALPAHSYNSGNQNVGLFVSGNDVYTCGVQKNGAGMEKAVLMKNGGKMGVDTLANVRSSAERIFISGNDIYMAGEESSVVRLWKNGVKQTLNNLPAEAYMKGCFVDGNDVYAVGEDRSQVPGRIDIVLWKNGMLSQRIGGPGIILTADGIAVSGGDVYICGHELISSTGYSIAKIWKNGTEQKISDGTKDVELGGIIVK